MVNPDLNSGDVRAISVFATYLSICGFLTALIIRDLLKQYRIRRHQVQTSSESLAFATSTQLFAACAAISLGITWYYMLGFFSLSYRAWASHHGISLPSWPHNIEDLGRWIEAIQLGAWLKDVQLFRDAWEVAMETHGRLLWSSPIFFATTLWSFFIGQHGMIIWEHSNSALANNQKVIERHIKHAWAYMLLGQLVAVSFAQSLFYLALTLYDMKDTQADEADEKKVADSTGTVASYVLLHRVIIACVFIPVFLIPEVVHTPRFLWTLCIPHLALMLPPIVDPLLASRLSETGRKAFVRQERDRLFSFVLLLSVIVMARIGFNAANDTSSQQHLHRHSEVYAHPLLESPSTSKNDSFYEIIASLYDHPAVSSVGWDSILCFLNYQIWQLMQSRR